MRRPATAPCSKCRAEAGQFHSIGCSNEDLMSEAKAGRVARMWNDDRKVAAAKQIEAERAALVRMAEYGTDTTTGGSGAPASGGR